MIKYLITGGAGFIGSALARNLSEKKESKILVLDKLTYAGHKSSLELDKRDNIIFEKIDIVDLQKVENITEDYQPDIIFHLAAESHVDRSIDNPQEFINTNVLGTFNMLCSAKKYLLKNNKSLKFLHISTDEVFGALGSEGLFCEDTPYDPRSPYSASKASSDHLCRAWFHTYQFPVIITNCGNNYGEYQSPEKLIPKTIINCIKKNQIPIYGAGKNIRDWIHVNDHVNALIQISQSGEIGESFNIGSNNEITNNEIVNTICSIANELLDSNFDYTSLIKYVSDRPGHDFRYAMDTRKINREIGWKSNIDFKIGIRKTFQWYIDNNNWIDSCLKKANVLDRQGKI
tara:strand:- start:1113 stop:2147 length:1035 start_codon:yes stop_codon:yes gene_type:complete